MRIKRSMIVGALLLLSVLLVACGGAQETEVPATEEPVREVVEVVEEPTEAPAEVVEEEPTEAPVEETATEDEVMMESMVELPAVDPLAVEGDIVVAGSSTVFPLAERMIEVFENEGYGGLTTYDSIGSGGGFERFCEAGESDISGASRAIKDTEVESCESIGRTPIEFRIGTDALAVVVSADNDFLADATLEELAAIFSTAETWADVNPDYPAEPILRYIPGTDSGTFDYFVEEVFDEDTAPILAASNTELSEDDNVLVTGVLDSPYAIAFFGFAYYQENADALNIISIDSVEANQENVDAAAYPLARPLYMYSSASIIAEKPQVGEFLSFVLSNVNEEIGDVGYFPANVEVLDGAKTALLEAMDAAPAMAEEAMAEESESAAGNGAEGSMLAPVDPLNVSGDIVVAGSSTVFPLAERMIEVFENEGYADLTTYDSIGSGGGFERFCEAGESDISGASRAIKDTEVESCEAIGRTPIEFRIGTDALAVVVSAENDFLADATLEELAAIFSTAETWADVNPDYPAEPILRYIPGTDSGTFDYFVEVVFDEDTAPILAASNTELSEDDNVLVTGVLDSPYAIAFFGFAYYQENASALNILSIDGVEANQENVDAAAYPIARPLYMYSSANIIAEKPQVGEFLSFVLQNVNEEIGDVGYFPANADILANAEAELAKAMGFGGEMEMMEESAMLAPVDPLDVSGDIVVAGSSTVFPLAERMIEVFENEGYSDLTTYDSIGSGGGFERFCEAGESDISGASRAIKDTEVESCEAIGRTPIEFRIGTDALAVVVSAENDFLADATLEELAAIFSTAETWADVNPDYPAEPILRYIPGTDSGTFDYFVEVVFDEDTAPILAASNTELSEDDNVLVTGVLDSPYAIAFFGFAYYQENASALNILSIDGVEANQENVDAAAYPIARPLYMYSSANIIAEKPQVGEFLSFVLQNVNEEIGDVGYFPANADILANAEAELAKAMGLGGEMEMMEESAMLAPVDPLDVSGDIVVAGSSTVFPLAERMIEVFENEGYADLTTYDSIGSGGGFERFCEAGESDISGASRAIKDTEVESCEAIGRTPIEFRIGTDALAVVVSAENDFLADATLEELAAIFSTAETWADVNPDYPAEPILRYIPGTDSGTFDYFVEVVFDEDTAPILAASNTELSEDDNVLVTGVLDSPYAIAFFGFAYYQENASALNILSIDGVEANQENVDAAAYPIARPLYMYSSANIIAEKPQVGEFLSFVLQNVNEEIGDVGYFPANDSVLDEAKAALAAAMGQ